MGSSIISIIKGSTTIMVLIALSVVVFTLILERFIYLRRSSLNADKFMDTIKNILSKKSYDEGLHLCDSMNKPLTNVIRTGIANRQLGKEDVEELMVSTRLEEKAGLEKFLVFLGSMGSVGPLLGLLGTVQGLSRAFKDLALSGSAGPSVVAAGISEALYATITGLAIAIPTVLLYNYLMGNARKLNTEMEINTKRLLVWLYDVK